MVKSFFWLFATQVSGVAAALIVGIIVSRKLGPEGQGLCQLAILVPVAMTLMLAIGGGAGPSFLIGRGAPVKEVWGWLVVLAVSATAVTFLVLTWFPSVWPRPILTSIPWNLRMGLLVYVPLQILANGGAAILVAQDRMRYVFWVGMLPRLGQLAALIIVALGWGLTVVYVATIYVWMPFLGLLVSLIAFKGQAIPRWRLSIMKHALGFGIKGHLGNVAQFLNYRVGLYVTGLMLMPRQTGLYWLAVTFSELLWYAPSAVSSVLLPRVARSESDGTRTALIANAMGWGTVVLGGVAAVTSPWLLPKIWGVSFKGAVPLLWILLPGVSLFAWSKVLTGDLAGKGHPEWGTWSSLAGFAVVAAGSFLALRTHQVLWMATSQSLSYLVAMTLVVWGFRYVHSGEKVSWQSLFCPQFSLWWTMVRRPREAEQ